MRARQEAGQPLPRRTQGGEVVFRFSSPYSFSFLKKRYLPLPQKEELMSRRGRDITERSEVQAVKPRTKSPPPTTGFRPPVRRPRFVAKRRGKAATLLGVHEPYRHPRPWMRFVGDVGEKHATSNAANVKERDGSRPTPNAPYPRAFRHLASLPSAS